MRINKIPGYENILDIYTIDKEGNVFSESKNGYLSVGNNGRGYLTVSLKIKGERKWKKAYVHRLVAKAFIPNKDNKEEVNHINQNKKDNTVQNLEWVTRLENIRHGDAIERQVLARTEDIYVYDFLLNLVGIYRGMNQATINVLGYSDAKKRNVRIKEYFFVNKPLNPKKANEISNQSNYQSVVVEDTITKEKLYFPNNRRAREFFDGKVNVTNAIDKKWLVKKRYRIYVLDYTKLKDSPNLQE
ncbi:MAG: HNH endonuclease signature motif containing protein [Erysipelotrichaceae bacterium]